MRRSSSPIFTSPLLALFSALALFMALAPAAPAHAQTSGADAGRATADRSGFHFSVGLGTASMGASCDACSSNPFSDRLNGVSGFVQLGGAVNPQLVVTGEFMGWVSNDDPIFRRVAGLSLAILGYPNADSGFFVKGGVGGVRAIVEDDFLVLQTDAWMATTGVGYDIPVGSNLIVTPYLNYIRSFGGETTLNDAVSPVAVHPNAFQFGAALTVH
jgi:hypothetical protein